MGGFEEIMVENGKKTLSNYAIAKMDTIEFTPLANESIDQDLQNVLKNEDEETKRDQKI